MVDEGPTGRPLDRPAGLGARERTPGQRAGDRAEDAVASYLERRGWLILARNLHVGRSELDIVAIDPGPPARLVVVEVRWRRSPAFGLPEETLDRDKRASLRRGLGRLLEAGCLPDGRALPRLPVGLDVIALEPLGANARMRHYRDALG